MRIQKHALFTLFYLFSSLTGLLWAEKTPLHHDVYESWNTLSRQQLSDDGRYVSWEINPQQGDGWLFIKDLAKRSERFNSPWQERAICIHIQFYRFFH